MALVSADMSATYASVRLGSVSGGWRKYTAELLPSATDHEARLAVSDLLLKKMWGSVSGGWRKYTAELLPSATDHEVRLAVSDLCVSVHACMRVCVPRYVVVTHPNPQPLFLH